MQTVRGHKIVVDYAYAGDKFITLDGVERVLMSADLMINSASGPMCLAGVLGGMESGVSDSTTDIILECTSTLLPYARVPSDLALTQTLHSALREESTQTFSYTPLNEQLCYIRRSWWRDRIRGDRYLP